MLLWLALGAVCVALVLIALRLPLSLGSNVQARFEPSGVWVLACGLGLGPVALSAIAARGVEPFVTCHVFGRQWLRLPLSRWLDRARPKAPPPAEGEAETETEAVAKLTRFERGLASWAASLDPLEIVASLILGEERLFEVQSVVTEVAYSCRDVALTGRILAVLCVLSGILPERYVISQTPSWESEDRVVLSIDGKYRVWPGRVCVGIARSLWKHRSQAAKEAATVAPSS